MTRVVGLPRSFDTREEADEIAGELRESLQGFRWKGSRCAWWWR